jgi:hypothetical protein
MKVEILMIRRMPREVGVWIMLDERDVMNVMLAMSRHWDVG